MGTTDALRHQMGSSNRREHERWWGVHALAREGLDGIPQPPPRLRPGRAVTSYCSVRSFPVSMISPLDPRCGKPNRELAGSNHLDTLSVARIPG